MKKLFAALVLMCTFGVIIGFASPSNAAPGSADLRIETGFGFLGAALYGGVCNEGDEDVEQFTFILGTVTNYSITGLMINADPLSGGSTADDPGTIDFDTGVWTGLVKMGECVTIAIFGDITGAIGNDISFSASVSDSLLSGGTPNVDPNSVNDESIATPLEIVALPDLAIDTRLLTEGEITTGSSVSYEIVYHNVGDGFVPQGDSMYSVISFIVPDEATITGITDLDPSDNLTSDFGACFVRPASELGTGLASYTGTVASCLLTREGDLGSNTSYPFSINLSASSDFVSGEFNVYAIASGQDLDTLEIQRAVFNGEDPFETMQDMNNLSQLTYDNTELIPFATRCTGQNATTTNGTGCFRIAFNKLILESSFEISDLRVSAGKITQLIKITDYVWEVRVTEIPQGQTATLTLEEGSVLDYSAISSVQVLGENTIRFEAAGELPETGAGTLFPYALLILIVGLVLVRKFKNNPTEICDELA